MSKISKEVEAAKLKKWAENQDKPLSMSVAVPKPVPKKKAKWGKKNSAT